MSLESLKSFLSKARADDSIKLKLKGTKSQDEVIALAKEHGHEFGSEHFSQLSKEELDGVAGGKIKWHVADVPLMGYPIDPL